MMTNPNSKQFWWLYPPMGCAVQEWVHYADSTPAWIGHDAYKQRVNMCGCSAHFNDFLVFQSKLDSAIREMADKNALEVEGLTRDQLAEAIKQAIACGDFQRCVALHEGSQQVDYLPYREKQRLEAEASAQRDREEANNAMTECHRQRAERVIVALSGCRAEVERLKEELRVSNTTHHRQMNETIDYDEDKIKRLRDEVEQLKKALAMVTRSETEWIQKADLWRADNERFQKAVAGLEAQCKRDFERGRRAIDVLRGVAL